MLESLLPCVEINPRSPVRASVIWLHGLGADGNDFAPIVPELGLPDTAGIRFVFPHAPQRPVTINGGYVMRAWYDIVAANIAAREDEAGIRDSAGAVQKLIAREVAAGVVPENIVLAGFSQGGAIALYTALRCTSRLAGVLALSTYLPLPNRLSDEATAANAHTPIWMGHGVSDTVVPVGLAEQSRDVLRQAGYDVAWHFYSMGHSVVPDEIRTIGAWLTNLLSRPA